MNSYFVWDFDPEIFSIFFLKIRWYGLFFGLSFIVGFYFIKKIFEKENKSLNDLDSLFFISILGTIIGARLFHVIFYEPFYYLNNPVSVLKVWEGGLASHGGGIGIVTGLYLFIRNRPDYSFLWLTDILTIPVVFGGALIRIGNFFNSEIVGMASSAPWAIIFKRIDNIPRHPSQLYESLLYFITSIFLLFLYKKTNSIERRGLLTGVFLVVVFTGRIFLEFFKMKQESYNTLSPFNTGQLLSIPMIIAGIILLIKAFRINIEFKA